MSVYRRYNTVAQDPLVVAKAREEWRSYYKNPKDDPEDAFNSFVQDFAFHEFVREYEIEDAHREHTSVFETFPASECVVLLDKWIGRKYGNDYWIDYDIGKELCKWFGTRITDENDRIEKTRWQFYADAKEPFRTYPHNEIYWAVQTAKNLLGDILKWQGREDMAAYAKQKGIRDIYVHHHLLGLLHLMGEKGLVLFDHIASRLNYGDGQEFLWNSLKAWSPPSALLPSLRKAYQIDLSPHCGADIDMYGGMRQLVPYWRAKHAIDLFDDPVIGGSLRQRHRDLLL